MSLALTKRKWIKQNQFLFAMFEYLDGIEHWRLKNKIIHELIYNCIPRTFWANVARWTCILPWSLGPFVLSNRFKTNCKSWPRRISLKASLSQELHFDLRLLAKNCTSTRTSWPRLVFMLPSVKSDMLIALNQYWHYKSWRAKRWYWIGIRPTDTI